MVTELHNNPSNYIYHSWNEVFYENSYTKLNTYSFLMMLDFDWILIFKTINNLVLYVIYVQNMKLCQRSVHFYQ